MTADAAPALELALERMRADGAGEAVRAAFARRFAQLQDPVAGLLAGDVLEPVADVPTLEELDGHGDPASILDRLAVIKLNGGLGTSMGLRGPKSLIEVKPGCTIGWAFVSNSDNLGAEVDARIPAWADAHGVPFVMEVVRGTAADRKGGHIARHDERLVLRETAQAPPGDPSFTDVERWRFYNTNNLWIDLRVLQRLLDEDPAGPALPLIVNRKTVDPRDPSSPAVLQLETAMGAAIGAIDGARAILVPRTRFAPVKTTDDLLLVRSDAYSLDDAGHVSPTFDGPPPVVTLDPKYYRSLTDLERRFPAGAPSLRGARSLTVHGDVTFGANVQIVGAGSVTGPANVPDGCIIKA